METKPGRIFDLERKEIKVILNTSNHMGGTASPPENTTCRKGKHNNVQGYRKKSD